MTSKALRYSVCVCVGTVCVYVSVCAGSVRVSAMILRKQIDNCVVNANRLLGANELTQILSVLHSSTLAALCLFMLNLAVTDSHQA